MSNLREQKKLHKKVVLGVKIGTYMFGKSITYIWFCLHFEHPCKLQISLTKTTLHG